MAETVADLEMKVAFLARELASAREQQAATSAILSALAASPNDMPSLLNAIRLNAARLCDAFDTTIFLKSGERLAVVTHDGAIPIDFAELPLSRQLVTGRAVIDRTPVHVHDLTAERDEYPIGQSMALQMGFRTILSAPLLRAGEAIGAIMIRRPEVRPFTERQIELLKVFADEAVIALENARLFEEVEARNRDLTESLERQTAMSDILRVISRSPTDVQPVFETIAESAARLCSAHFCAVFRFDGELIHFVAQHGMPPEGVDAQHHAYPLPPSRASTAARAILNAAVEQVPDVEADPEYKLGDTARTIHARSILAVPMLRDGHPVGAITIARSAIGNFPSRQIELLQTFADQAVIALENVRLFDEVQARNRDLTESLERQTAMSDILRVISRSPTDVQPVFETIAESAARLCSARFCSVHRFDGELIYFVAQHGMPPEAVNAQHRAFPMRPGRGSAAARAILGAAVVQIPDVNADPDYQVGETARAISARSILAVPILREGRPIGSINIGRPEPGYFPPRQIELLQTFADQAVIAIENVRLFDEVQARTRDLTEALEQQTAASEILRVIARSPTEVQPVFDTIATSVARLCGARYCIVFRFDGELVHFVAQQGLPPVGIAGNRQAFPMPLGRGSAAARSILNRAVEQIPDVEADPDFRHTAVTRAVGVRSLVAVPILKDDVPAGSIVVAKPQPGLFSDRQVELVQTFADQAVIALENVRLFDEVQARSAELSEALQQQTATADVLKVISRSAFDLQAVLDTLTRSAAELCGADMGAITMPEGGRLRFRAGFGQSPELRLYEETHPHPLTRGTFQGRAALEKATVHVPDVLEDAEYERKEAAALGNFRASLAVPLRRGDDVIGVFGLARKTPGPFAPRQIELVETFADQAVIAIENARLFDEVQARSAELSEALQQQTATADVLKVISRSAFDLQAVLDTLTRSAAELCGADLGSIARQEGDGFYYSTNHNLPPEWQTYVKDMRLTPGRGSVIGRSLLDRDVVHVVDVLADPEYTFLDSAKAVWFRTVLGVPLLREGSPIGVLVLGRRNVSPFSGKQIELVQTFADQAVIAIENARLFDEVQARTAELTEALQQQTATADVLKVISRSAFDLQPVLQALVDSALRLCDADMGNITLREGETLRYMAGSGQPPELRAYERDHPHRFGRGSFQGRSVIEGRTVHVPDALADPEYERKEAALLGEFRAVLAVPLKRGDEVIGVFGLARRKVGLFSPRQVELVEGFADQAVIAIENVRLFGEVQARTAQLSEALQQQTATAEVLKAISRSTFDLQTVLNTLVESAAKLCGANVAQIFRWDGAVLRWAAGFALSPEYLAIQVGREYAPGRGSLVGRVAAERQTVLVSDALADPEYEHKEHAEIGRIRTMLGVPLLRSGEFVGAIALARDHVEDFNDRQIELVQTFADQAVIAIENVRLFDEIQARTAEVTEALQQQTATADVLKVISRSAFDLQSVLQTLIESALNLCGAEKGGIYMLDSDAYRLAAQHGMTSEFFAVEKLDLIQMGRATFVGRTALEKAVVHVPDVSKDAEYGRPDLFRIGEFAAVLSVPLLREGTPIGVFSMSRTKPGPFTERQIELVQTFADQAVIAIENVRLFDEVQRRTKELQQALEYQTATSEVLNVISRSPSKVQPVLNVIIETAVRLCEADFGTIAQESDGRFFRTGQYGSISAEFREFMARAPVEMTRGSITGRTLVEGKVVHVLDAKNDPEYTWVEALQAEEIRSGLGVPLIRDGAPIGAIALVRRTVRPFTEKQIELVTTFADQAVIAIENARLFEEVQARTQDLTRSLVELRTAQDRLVQTEKLASLGQLTAGIAHEIKNPLNFVNNFAALSTELVDELRESLEGAKLDEKSRQSIAETTQLLKGNLQKVVLHGRRADSIVKNMLLHSRAGSGEHRPSDINSIVEEALNLAYHGARAEKQGFNITMEKSLDPSAGEVDLFPQEITRVLLNLISNGFYAATKRRAQSDGGYEPILSASTKSLGKSVEIRIRDNGTGISPEVKERMFNPFFTTKPAGEGTGLGLSLSHDIIVKQHAGTIEVETEQGAFTEFRIVLPRGAASVAKSGGNA